MEKIDPEKWEAEHLRHIAEYLRQIDRLYDTSTAELVRLGMSCSYNPDDGELLSFDGEVSKRKQADKLLKEMHDKLVRIVEAGITTQWAFANRKNDALVTSLFADPDRAYMLHNLDALEAFMNRRAYGHTLSSRVWSYTKQFEDNIAMSLSVGISEGRSAAQISRDVRNYLLEPDKLFRRVRDRFGNLVLSKNARAYHPGQGVYRSSYQNALRMAQTEINSAYRQSDHERWQQLDFVVGIEIKTSKTHAEWLEKYWKKQFAPGNAPEEICDALAGKYPKDFKFIGWHPRCKCHAVAILSDAGQGKKWWEGRPENEVRDVPDNFKKWMSENSGRIAKANERGTLPYWIKENPKYTDIQVSKDRVLLTPEQKAYRKEIQREAIAKFKGVEVENRMKIRITASGIKEYLNQPHAHYFEKNELVRNLPNVISSSEYLGSVPYHKSNPNIVRTHIFGYPIGGTNSYLLAREELSGDICFYSVTDSDKIFEYLKTK